MIVKEIEIDLIDPPRYAIRVDPEDPSIMNLAQSISQIGLINPIAVKPVENGRFEVVAGHRRYLACKSLQMKTVMCTIVHSDTKLAEAIKIVENIQRKGISSFEEIVAIAKYVEEHRLSAREAENMLGISRQTILNYLTLAGAPDDIQKALHEKLVNTSVAMELMKIQEDEDRIRLTKMAAEYKWTAAQTRYYVDQHIAQKKFQEELEKNRPTVEPEPPKMETTIDCQMCEEKVNVNHLRSIVICPNCLDILMAAKLNEKIGAKVE